MKSLPAFFLPLGLLLVGLPGLQAADVEPDLHFNLVGNHTRRPDGGFMTFMDVATTKDHIAAAGVHFVPAPTLTADPTCDFLIGRFERDGVTSPGFTSTVGLVPEPFTVLVNMPPCQANAVAIQPNDRILAAGTGVLPAEPPGQSNLTDFTVVRLLTTGTLDPTFGTGGIVMTDIRNQGKEDIALDMELTTTPSGPRILVAGFTVTGVNNRDFAIASYLPNGSLDKTFGDTKDGVVVLDFPRAGGSSDDWGRDIAIGPNGDIFFFGHTIRNNVSNFAWAQLSPDGRVLRQEVIQRSGNQTHPSVDIDTNGRIALTGLEGDSVIAMRLLPNGQLDSTFGVGGVTLTGWSTNDLIPGRMKSLRNGGMAVAFPELIDNTSSQYVETLGYVGRLTSTGQIDASFAPDGRIEVVPGEDETSFPTAVDEAPDGKLVVVGRSMHSVLHRPKSLVARYGPILTNMGFEVDDDKDNRPDGWWNVNLRPTDLRICPSVPQGQPSPVFAGKCFFRVVGDGASGFRGIRQQIFRVGRLGDQITLEVTRRATSFAPNEGNQAIVQIKYPTGWVNHVVDLRTNSGVWTTATLSITATANYSEIVVTPVWRRAAAAGSVFDIDQVVLLVDQN